MIDAAWPDRNASKRPDWYEDCFRNALRRVAVTLNARVPHERCRAFKRTRSDGELAATFLEKGWDRHLVQFHVNTQDPFTVDDPQFQAEYFFYSDVDFLGRGDDRIARFSVPETFLDWGYTQLHEPRGTDEALDLAEFGGDRNAPDFVRHCAANYLVKNFWHNFVHRAHQGVTSSNYHQFGGDAREDSDFEADHLGNMLLLKSYGLPVLSSGSIGPDNARRIAALFQRNRCNTIFAERARNRKEDRSRMSLDERWADQEWRFRRNVSNQVSMALLTRGLATPSVRVFLTGEVRRGEKKGAPKIWRKGEVVVDIGGRRINTAQAPYLPFDDLEAERSGTPVTTKRASAIRRFHQGRIQEVVNMAVPAYAALVRDDARLRESTGLALSALWARLGIED